MAEQPNGTETWYPKRDPSNLVGDGREEELAECLSSQQDVLRGSPSRVLRAIDKYCQSTFMINVGARKAEIVKSIIAQTKPKIMVELGGYIGYSAIAFGDAIKSADGTKYYSLEANEKYAGIARSSIQLAGLDKLVKVEVGMSDVTLRRLHASGQLRRIDILFIDHYKPAYEHDLKVCEDLGLIREGTVIIADDVELTQKQAPGYFKYIYSTVGEKTEAVEESRKKEHPGKENWYLNEKPAEGSKVAVGNPNLQYVSKLIECLDSDGKKDGLEVTKCVKIWNENRPH